MNDLIKKAFETNGCNFLDFAKEPNFNKLTIQKRIDLLNIEISDIQKGAFATKSCNGVTYSGCDIVDLQAKIVLRDSLIENLKTEKLL